MTREKLLLVKPEIMEESEDGSICSKGNDNVSYVDSDSADEKLENGSVGSNKSNNINSLAKKVEEIDIDKVDEIDGENK